MNRISGVRGRLAVASVVACVGVTAGDASAALNCSPGSAAYLFPHQRPAKVPHYVLGCRRLHEVGRVQVQAHRMRSGEFCVTTYVPSERTAFGCGTYRVRRHVDVNAFAGTREDGYIVAGASSARARRVVYRYTLNGVEHQRRAALIRVRSQSLLRRLKLDRPFGAHRVFLPQTATQVTVEAFDASGRSLEVEAVRHYPPPFP